VCLHKVWFLKIVCKYHVSAFPKLAKLLTEDFFLQCLHSINLHFLKIWHLRFRRRLKGKQEKRGADFCLFQRIRYFCVPEQNRKKIIDWPRHQSGTKCLRPILNFALRGKLCPQGRSCPPGVNFIPWDWSYPLEVKFSVCPSILLNSRECSPLGVKEGVNIPPRGQISLLGAKFTPRGEVLPWGPGVKLRMALSKLQLKGW
jgi:hypothetical protein